MAIIASKSDRETARIAAMLAQEVKETVFDRAVVVALEGDLGAGKTTFTQGFARGLGIRERVLSPTFVVMKIYGISSRSEKPGAGRFVHIDAYRIDTPEELLSLGFGEILGDKNAIILIEWADRIAGIVPEEAVWIRFAYGKKEEERVIEIKSKKEWRKIKK